MPSVPATSGSWLKGTLNSLQAQINAIATQQNHGVVDNTLTRRINWGWQSDTNTYGVVIFDPSGNKRVVLGQLLPAKDIYVAATLSTTSATPAGIAGSPSITVNIGNAGDCEITAGAFVGSATNNSSTAYLVIDGVNEGSIFGLGSGSSVAGNVQSTRRISSWLPAVFPLAAGSHTFTMLHESNTGGTAAQFSANYLKVQPL